MLRFLLLALLSFRKANARPADTPPPGQLGPPPPGGYSLVALGDSYTTAVGAGTRVPNDKGCRLFDGSYAYQLMRDPDLHINQDASVSMNLACAGATLPEIQNFQISAGGGAPIPIVAVADEVANADYLVLTGGGNDVGFFWILNNCVYGFVRFLGSCESTADSSEGKINDPRFYDNLKETMRFALSGGKKQQRLFVLGYSAFFNQDTPACDPPSWYYYQNNPKYQQYTKDYDLTPERRLRANKAVMALNQKIEQAANETPGATYIDINNPFNGHRFCEENNPPAWFFNNMPPTDAQNLNADILAMHQDDFPPGDNQWQGIVGWEYPDNGTNLGSGGSRYPNDEDVRVFHPTLDGQTGMYNAVKAAM